MGLDRNGLRFLLYCRQLGVDFSRTAMVGRQALLFDKRDLRTAFDSSGCRLEESQVDAIFDQSGGYAEHLLKSLGANEVHSFDISGYEGATHLHDMNRELPQPLRAQYSMVLDGGSLEHVFNFPVALRNCMDMVKVGGHFLAITPGNNFLGHGFYQFSPELYFSAFTPENGFELLRLIAFEESRRARWYLVGNPLELRSRVTLTNRFPLYLLVVARRLASTPIFQTLPQQSDYLSTWHDTATPADSDATKTPPPLPKRLRFLELAKRTIPAGVRRRLPGFFRRTFLRIFWPSPFDPRFFSPFDPTDRRTSAQ